MDERHQPPIYYALTALMSLPLPTPRLDTEMDLNPYYRVTHEGNLSRYAGVVPATAPVLYVGRMVSVFLGLNGERSWLSRSRGALAASDFAKFGMAYGWRLVALVASQVAEDTLLLEQWRRLSRQV